MKHLKISILSLVVTVLLSIPSFMACTSVVYAASGSRGDNGAASAKVNGDDYDTGLPHVNASSSQLHQILSVAFAVIGAVALLFVVIGGLRYILAGGDSQAAAKARDTIIYAAIGVIIVIAAEIIVAFVLDKL